MTTGTAAWTPPRGAERTSAQKPGRRSRYLFPAIGASAVVLSAIGLSGVGDASDPHEPAAAVTAHFVAFRDDVLLAAPIGYLGATLLVGFVFALAHRIVRSRPNVITSIMVGGGIVVGLYFAALHVVYTTLSYQVAGSSPDAAKALFVATILAVPVFGAAVAVLLSGAAYGAWRWGSMPRSWSVVSALGAAVAVLAVISYRDSGYFSPDVQQQVVGNVLFVWVLLTAGTLAARPGTSDDENPRPRP